jgi:hypothetical protein
VFFCVLLISTFFLHVSHRCTDPVQSAVTNDMKQAATTAEQHSNHIDNSNNNVQTGYSGITTDTPAPPTVVPTSQQCRAPSSSVTDSMQPAINKIDGVVSKLNSTATAVTTQ